MAKADSSTSSYGASLPRLAHRFPEVPTSRIYHYCSPETFLVICRRPSVRACDINKMNDHLEFQWGFAVLQDAVKLFRSDATDDFCDRILSGVEFRRSTALPIIACFSTDGDVLSQWRAYAADGGGFSIGFDLTSIEEITNNVYPVVYDRGDQLEFLKQHLSSLYEVQKTKKKKELDIFFNYATTFLYGDLCFYKNPAFAEEKEVRLIYLMQIVSDGCLKVVDPDDISENSINYFIRDANLIAYCDFTLEGDDCVLDVIRGPRNPNSALEVEGAVSCGPLRGVTVGSSKASYRR